MTSLPPFPQEDYHKLLTKYAEAENTIDQLRLGAKVPGRVGWRGGGVEGCRGGGVTLFPSHCLLPPETLGLGDAVLPCSTVGSLCDPGAATCPLQAADEL